MGLFKKLFGAGVVAGTTVAAMKVAEKKKRLDSQGLAKYDIMVSEVK